MAKDETEKKTRHTTPRRFVVLRRDAGGGDISPLHMQHAASNLTSSADAREWIAENGAAGME